MKKYLIICLLFLGLSINASAQETVEVTGTVLDKNREPLIGVNISVSDVPGLGTVTDVDGKFNQRLKMKVPNMRTFGTGQFDINKRRGIKQ